MGAPFRPAFRRENVPMTEGTDESEDIAIARALLGESSNSMPIDELRKMILSGHQPRA